MKVEFEAQDRKVGMTLPELHDVVGKMLGMVHEDIDGESILPTVQVSLNGRIRKIIAEV